MHPLPRKTFCTPALTPFGTLVTLTAAVGGGANNDQSDFPQMFPPNKGSYDICHNNSPTTVC